MVPMKARAWPLAALIAASACSGGGNATDAKPIVVPAVGVVSCPAFAGGVVSDPIAQPANGAAGVSTSVGSVTAPNVAGLAGLQVTLVPPSPAVPVMGGTFAASSGSALTASVPALAPHTTYFVQATATLGTGPQGCAIYELFQLGSFTTA
jgi:hypothetical protein